MLSSGIQASCNTTAIHQLIGTAGKEATSELIEDHRPTEPPNSSTAFMGLSFVTSIPPVRDTGKVSQDWSSAGYLEYARLDALFTSHQAPPYPGVPSRRVRCVAGNFKGTFLGRADPLGMLLDVPRSAGGKLKPCNGSGVIFAMIHIAMSGVK